MSNVLTYLTQYWAIIVAAVFAVAYGIANRKSPITYARSRIKTFMIAAEKRAEALVLANGQAKLAWVVSNAYDLLPGVVRLFVSKPLFVTLVQAEYNVAVAWAEKHIIPATDLPV